MATAVSNTADLVFAVGQTSVSSISLAVGTYVLSSALEVSRNLTLRANAGGDRAVLSAPSSRVLVVSAGASVDLYGLAIRDGVGGTDLGNDGGCIHNSGTLRIFDSNITGCESKLGGCCGRNGGGIMNEATGILELFSTVVTSNTASGNGGPTGGGIYNLASTPAGLTDSSVTNNQAYRDNDIYGSFEIRYYSPSPPPPSPVPPLLPPFHNPGFDYYDGYTYGTVNGEDAATVVTIVTGESDTYTGADINFQGTVLHDPFFDSAFGSQRGHEHITRQGYVTSNHPVWTIDLTSRRVYIKAWASSDGLLYVSSSRSVGMLNDFRLWGESAPGGWTQQPTASIGGDPHIKGASGGEADFKGEDGKYYNLLSSRNVTVNALFEHRNFSTPYSRLQVHGSWVMGVFLLLSTARSTLRIPFLVRHPHDVFVSRSLSSPRGTESYNHTRTGVSARQREQLHVREGSGPIWVDGVRFSLQKRTLRVENPFWQVIAKSTLSYPHFWQLRANVWLMPRYAIDLDPVAPHGLLGQTFDRSNCTAVNGKRDDYSVHRNRLVVTSAQAEGAIEGTAADYMVASPFATRFKYSRHTASHAAPRLLDALYGRRKRPRCIPGRWDSKGGVGRLVDGLNFQGHDLEGTWRAASAVACYDACKARAADCRAFTFIKGDTRSKRCWLKLDGYQAMGVLDPGTVSGVLSAEDRALGEGHTRIPHHGSGEAKE